MDDLRKDDFPFRCGCGRPYTRRAWAKLPYVGRARLGGYHLELRNCACGTSMSVRVVGRGGPEPKRQDVRRLVSDHASLTRRYRRWAAKRRLVRDAETF